MDEAKTSVEGLTGRLRSTESLSSIAEAAAAAPAWARDFVAAAERRVREVEAALQSTRTDVSRLRTRAEALIAENEELRSRPEGRSERAELLLSENALMAEEAQVLQAELERVSGEAKAREAEQAELAKQRDAAQARVGELESAVTERTKEVEALERRYVEHGAELASARGQVAELKEGLESLHQQNEALRDEVDEKTRTIGELADRVEVEGEELWQKVQDGASRARELQETLATKTREAEAAADKVRRTARELETVKTDNAGMLRVMSGMEKQLAAYAAREESVAAVARDAKEKAENALLARDKSAAREAQAGRELDKERAARATDAKDAQQDRDAAVHAVQAAYHAKLQARDAELQAALERAATATSRADKAARDADAVTKKMGKLQEAFDSLEARLIVDVVADHEKKRLDAELKLRELSRASTSILRPPASAVPPEARKLQQQVDQLDDELRVATADADAATAKARDLADALVARDRDLARLQKALDDDKARHAKVVADMARQADADKRRCDDALLAARKANDDAHVALSQQAERHRVQLDKLHDDRNAATHNAAARLQDEAALVAKLSAYDRDLEIRLANTLADLQAEKQGAKIAQRRASDLAAQLAKSLAEQDALLKRTSRATPLAGAHTYNASSSMATTTRPPLTVVPGITPHA